MSTQTNQMESKVETVDIDIDTLFAGTPSAEAITLPDEENKPKSIFSKKATVDMSFADPNVDKKDSNDESPIDDLTSEEKEEKPLATKEDVNSVLDSFDTEDEDESSKEQRGRKKINGISDVFEKLIKSEKIVPFDDDKSLEEYTAKDWEELIEANLEERAQQARRETPKQFFESLPQELQVAARYVADGGQDLKGLFATLAQVEETKNLDPKSESGQEYIIREYLHATGYGSEEEIAEEIEVWKDLGKLEQQALKFKPKLDKMQDQVVAQKLQEQEMRKKQQENASRQYMENVYNTLKDGDLGELKIDRKVQAMLYNGLVQPNYPSVSGKNTNLLGHLLEKYQFVEPNYTLISEALWLLSDPDGYKSKIMEKGSNKVVENTVRKLKTEQTNSGGSSLGVQERDSESASRSQTRKIARPTNIFKRI